MRKRFVQVIRSWIVGVMVLGLTIVYLLAGGFGAVIGFSLFSDWRAWYFPGDAAVAELALTLEGVALAAAVLGAALLFSVGLRRHRGTRVALVLCLGLVAVSASIPVLCVANRHFGEWSQFRALAWRYVESARSRGEVAEKFEKPPEFRFAHWTEPVRLRAVTTGRWPTILVDFGNGGTAEFDLRTMWCTYSD